MAITISGSGITSANIADGTITTDDILASDVSSLKSGRKNLIINGGFDVWQRGTSFTPAPIYNYSADRARLSSSSVVNITKESATLDGNTVNTIKHSIVSPSVGDAVRYDQRIEEFDYFKNKTFTLSFWVKASRTHALDSSFLFFGGGGVNTITFSLGDATTSWTKKTATFTVGDLSTATGTYADMVLGISSDGSPIDIEFAQVQLEVGSVATDFEHRSYGEELALCQRYYQKHPHNSTGNVYIGRGYCGSNAHAYGTYSFPTMRAAPSASYTGQAHANCTGDFAITALSATSGNIDYFSCSGNVSAENPVRVGNLHLDAEL